jgi:DNA-binding NtrC family response regulator
LNLCSSPTGRFYARCIYHNDTEWPCQAFSTIPPWRPLRDRPSDITLLAEHFFQLAKARAKRSFTGIHPDALNYLSRLHWPGNVRELRNCIERAMAMAQGDVVGLADVQQAVALPADDAEAAISLAEAEHRHIARMLRRCGGNMREAARILDISRTTLYKKIRDYGIKV